MENRPPGDRESFLTLYGSLSLPALILPFKSYPGAPALSLRNILLEIVFPGKTWNQISWIEIFRPVGLAQVSVQVVRGSCTPSLYVLEVLYVRSRPGYIFVCIYIHIFYLSLPRTMATLLFGQHIIKTSAVFLRTELSFALVNRKPVVPGRIFF